MASLVFDLLALADTGGQPRRLATVLLDQMRRQLGTLPLPVPLEEIARALGISDIVSHETDAFDGMLVAKPDRSAGIISLRDGLVPGRRNFTLGHEIGHFVSWHHEAPADGFKCAAGKLKLKRDRHAWDALDRYDRMEIEANEFSQAILVPTPEYRAETQGMRESDLAHIETLRLRFGVSKEMMAQIYVNTADADTAVVISRHGRFNRLIAKKSFPYLGLRSGSALPTNCLTKNMLGRFSAGHVSNPEAVLLDTWIENARGCVALTEQVYIQREGWAMTMLVVEMADYEQREDDDRVERSWSGPKFAYGR